MPRLAALGIAACLILSPTAYAQDSAVEVGAGFEFDAENDAENENENDANAENGGDPEASAELAPEIIGALALGAGAPAVCGGLAVLLIENLNPRGAELAGVTAPLVAIGALAPSIGWWLVGEERAAWTSLGTNLGVLMLGVAGSLWYSEEVGLVGGDTVLRGMSWVSLAALTLASFVPLTQTTSENAGGLRMDPAARERALLAGTGAMSALTAGVLATSFAFSDRGPHWESTGAAIAVTALAPALTYAMNGEWQVAGESLLVGVLAVVMSGLLSVVSAPLMAAQDPDHDFAEVFFRAFALATTAIVPISSVGYAAIRTAEERAAAEPNRDAR